MLNCKKMIKSNTCFLCSLLVNLLTYYSLMFLSLSFFVNVQIAQLNHSHSYCHSQYLYSPLTPDKVNIFY